MKFYLSGPMSGYPDLNRAAFDRAAGIMRRTGLTVVSPAEMPDGEWDACLRRDMAVLLECQAIVLLEGWPRSKGAKLELLTAVGLGMPVFFYRDDLGIIDMNAEGSRRYETV